MTECQNCGEYGECNEQCGECGAMVDPCGEPDCPTCVEQFMVFNSEGAADEDEGEGDECPIECRCIGECALEKIEQEINENAQAEKGKGKL